MAEYIDKSATVGILEAMSRSADCECIKKRLEKAAKRVSAIPAADVAPVVHGRWDDSGRYTFPGGSTAVRCNNCGCALTVSEYHLNNWNYCPVCGAKMDGGLTMPEFRRLTYKTPNGAWGIEGVSLLSCPARLYGAAAKLCDMESLCEDVFRAKDAELTLDALQELVDKGLGGRFLDLRRALKGVTL